MATTPLEQARHAAARGNRRRAAYQAAAHDFRHLSLDALAELKDDLDEDYYWELNNRWETVRGIKQRQLPDDAPWWGSAEWYQGGAR